MYCFLMDEGSASCTSSQEREGAYWAECFSDIPASVLSRLNLTAETSCSNDSETESCQSSQSGMMLRRSTGTRGAGSLMWYAGGSHVRTYLPPAKELASAANALGCGPSSPGSLAKYNPALYGWKTRQCSLFVGLEWFSETFPRWGMMRDGELFPLSTPGLPTSETVSGFWPTPCASEARQGLQIRRDGKKWTQQSLSTAVRMWPTPKASTAGPDFAKTERSATGMSLQTAVAMEKPEIGGQLNPTWVEWLMGWPIGWTDLKPLEMDKFALWLNSHGKYSAKDEHES
jgi:hypothetical protein